MILILLAGGLLVGLILRAPASDDTLVDTNSDASGSAKPPTARLAAMADDLGGDLEAMAHPSDALAHPELQAAVAFLAGPDFTAEQTVNYAVGANWALRVIGLLALTERDGAVAHERAVMKSIPRTGTFALYFVLRYLHKHSQTSYVGAVMAQATYRWDSAVYLVEALADAVEFHVQSGREITFLPELAQRDEEDRECVDDLLTALPKSAHTAVWATYQRARSRLIDESFLKHIGRFMAPSDVSEAVYPSAEIDRLFKQFVDERRKPRSRSVIVVGPSGVGKSALVRKMTGWLLEHDWRVFHTSGKRLIADQSYVGEIEGQLRRLAENATVHKKVVMLVDRMAELDSVGRTKGNPDSVLDQLWPDIEGGRIVLLSESTPSALQAIQVRYPTLSNAVLLLVMRPSPEEEARTLARRLLDERSQSDGNADPDGTVDEVLKLAQQFLSHKCLPGSVLTLLDQAIDKADGEVTGREQVLAALSDVSGLPKSILDDEQTLEVDDLREAFRSRVIGQDEAVDCLVECVAMIKAGLSDPGRPNGVFLFAGPTGTGKTEIAKTLAEVLFGSKEQMIRLDMSEYQSGDSSWRLISHDTERRTGGSLVSRIREQPFTVVLLDEFEKAHPNVWDLFLQVFDDGRLTDTRGESADFRHAIVLLTSNLGATIAAEAGMGFTNAGGGFVAADVERMVTRTFRREFINRLDRLVVFNPLSRGVMRKILRKELEAALERRGLRNREWVVEWEDSAIEFLLSEGFTPDLGARPLRRAIERHLLAPLSLTMVQNRAPEGEQFLFVRSDGDTLDVRFVDPDAAEDERPLAEAVASETTLPAIMLSSSVIRDEHALIESRFRALSERIDGVHWREEKQSLFEMMSALDFWTRTDRRRVLDRVELIDRIEAAHANLSRLVPRMSRSGSDRTLVVSLAGRLYVLGEGLKDLDDKRPTDALIGARLVTEDRRREGAADFLGAIGDMYRSWGRARGMRIAREAGVSSRYPIVWRIEGFGSYGLLASEAGVHVLEVPAKGGRFERVRVRVNVVDGDGSLDDTVQRETRIVRRYRYEPSPLVRDGVYGWRTGRIDQVLTGAFDLFGAHHTGESD